MSARAPQRWSEDQLERLEQRIAIEADGSIVARSGKVEYGQGIRTGFAKIVAEELDVPLERVRVELGETDHVPWDMGTFGSLSTATDGKSLRAAAAYARMLLLARAAARLQVPQTTLATQAGRVVAQDGRALAYEELTRSGPLTGVVPAEVVGLHAPAPVESAPLRLEGFDIVTGRARYAADVRLPGMLRGHVLRPRVPGARLVALDEGAARALPGVVAIVRGNDFVGVVATRNEQALAGVRALSVRWSDPKPPRIREFDLTLRHDPSIEAALADAARRFSARYHIPHIAHAPIGPSAAVADVRPDGVDIYAATQRPFAVRDDVAAILGVPPERVHVHPQAMGGMYGRGNVGDAALEAMRLSHAVKRPVLVQWTREEEFQFSPHRPVLDAELEAAIDASGAIVAWRSDIRTNPHTYGGGDESERLIEMTSGRNSVPHYRLGKIDVRLRVTPAAIRTGAFRSLAAAPNIFAIESFIDELAHASDQDPIAFRLRLAPDPRLRRVLETVRSRSEWEQRPRHEPRRGFGVACAVYNGTYIAQVAEVRVGENGVVHLESVWCAVDPGRLVHPDGVRNQIEGGIQQAASWTLLEELRDEDGEIVNATWRDYPIATFRDAPRTIDVTFAAQHDAPSTGTGEPGTVPTAAAIANAVFAATGTRVRRLPISPVR